MKTWAHDHITFSLVCTLQNNVNPCLGVPESHACRMENLPRVYSDEELSCITNISSYGCTIALVSAVEELHWIHLDYKPMCENHSSQYKIKQTAVVLEKGYRPGISTKADKFTISSVKYWRPRTPSIIHLPSLTHWYYSSQIIYLFWIVSNKLDLQVFLGKLSTTISCVEVRENVHWKRK